MKPAATPKTPPPTAKNVSRTKAAANDERLLTVLHSLEDLITKQTSLRFAFFRGAVYGLGTVIGATLLIAILGGALVATVNSLADLPFIGDYIENNASEYIEKIDAQ